MIFDFSTAFFVNQLSSYRHSLSYTKSISLSSRLYRAKKKGVELIKVDTLAYFSQAATSSERCSGRPRRIARDVYDKKLKEYKEKQHEIGSRMEELTNADENYHITAATLFSLTNRALEIFESSEVDEKRQLLNFLLQNCRLSGKNLLFELKSPFNVIANSPAPTLGSE